MARPRKCRRICSLPKNACFGPVRGGGEAAASAAADEILVMALDEYETIRLIDLMEFTQEECAAQMGVARTTVQAVYNTARKKLALSLVEGRQLVIRGGDYILCPHGTGCCGRNCERCFRMEEQQHENCGDI